MKIVSEIARIMQSDEKCKNRPVTPEISQQKFDACEAEKGRAEHAAGTKKRRDVNEEEGERFHRFHPVSNFLVFS